MPLPTIAGFINQGALYAALLIIPILLLYLLKPKPKNIKFPTTMFIKKLEEIKRFSSFFNRFIKDPLLLLQILIIIILVLAMANPFALLEKTTSEDEAVALVIDASASMKANDVNPTRFEAAVAKAKEIVSDLGEESKVSIILAENIPVTILSNGNVKKALGLLNTIECADTTSNTADALILAKDLLSQSNLKKTAYLISDFAITDGDLLTNRRMLRMNGMDVYFIKFNEDGKNLGIVDIEAKRTPLSKNTMYLTYTIRNYDEVEHDVTAKVYINNNLDSMKTQTIKPDSDTLFYINPSISQDRQFVRIEMLDGGALNLDDMGYAVIPLLRTYRTMLLTTGDKDKYVSYAIESQSNNNLRTVEPPVIPSFNEFDTIIIGGIKEDTILPGTFRDIKNFVQGGDSLVVIASEDLMSIDDPNFKELMPVTLKELVNAEKSVISISHEMLSDISLENSVVKRYYAAEKKENATVIAETEGNPLIAVWKYGKGKVAYIGINPSKEWSTLQYSSSFPIFWMQVIEYVNQKERQMSNFNYKTGEYIVLGGESDITNPVGIKTKEKSIFLNREGFYSINSENGEETIAANLLSEEESDIKTAFYDEEAMAPVKAKEKTTKEELFKYLLIFATAMLFIEMYVYRKRGLL